MTDTVTATTFLSVGSTIFFYLFYKSGYIPKLLAGWGVLASILMMMVTLGTLVFPEHERTLQIGWGPIGIAEIGTAFWLMLRGIRPLRPDAGEFTRLVPAQG